MDGEGRGERGGKGELGGGREEGEGNYWKGERKGVREVVYGY